MFAINGTIDGVPLVGPQEELRGPSGYTPRVFTSSPRREAKSGLSGVITTNKQTNKHTFLVDPLSVLISI